MSSNLLLLIFLSLSLCHPGLGEDLYLLPAAQVLSFLSEVDWKDESTLSLMRAVMGRVRSEYRLLGPQRFRAISQEMMDFLRGTSELTAKHQIQTIVEKILDNNELILPGSRVLLHKFREELKDSNTQLNNVLTHTLPLIYN